MDVLTLCKDGNYGKIQELVASKSCIIKSEIYKELFMCACLYGHIKIVELLIKQKCDINIPMGLYYAGLGDKKDIIYMLLEMKSTQKKDQSTIEFESKLLYTVCGVCHGGHLKLLKKLIKDKVVTKEELDNKKYNIFKFACRSGNNDIIDFLVKYDLYDWESGFIGACQGGKLEIVKWIYRKSDDVCSYIDNVFTHGVRSGNLQLILWAKEIVEHEDYKYASGVPWDTVFNLASEEGHIEIVTWVIDNHRKYIDLYEGFRRACSNNKKKMADLLIEKSKKQNWKTWPIYTNIKSSTYYKNCLDFNS